MYEILARKGSLDTWTTLAYTDDYSKAVALVIILNEGLDRQYQFDIRRLVVI